MILLGDHDGAYNGTRARLRFPERKHSNDRFCVVRIPGAVWEFDRKFSVTHSIRHAAVMVGGEGDKINRLVAVVRKVLFNCYMLGLARIYRLA